MATYVDRIQAYLREQGVEFEVLHHPIAYTAQEVAGAQHVPGKQMVKVVLVKAGEDYLMCLLPAIHLIDFDQLKAILGTEDVRLALEDEVSRLFPDCAVGAEPPFGSWYDLSLYYDASLDECDSIVFNAGTHTDTVRMRWHDFKKLENPKLVDCWVHI
jgi:Ala-tRNA(Pro) deacylase